MLKSALLLFLLLTTSMQSFACCAESIYRLLPIGEFENQVVFVEFKLHRNCDMGDDEFTFWTKGLVSLVRYHGDSLQQLQCVDTIDIVDCYCNYMNYYEKTIIESEITKSYLQALNAVRKLNGFTEAIPESIVFNDTMNIQKYEEYTDSSFVFLVRYRDVFTMDLSLENFISCAPEMLAEVRVYKTAHYRITVLRMRCWLLQEDAIEHNRKRYSTIETAIWKEQAQWHGIAKDFMMIEALKP